MSDYVIVATNKVFKSKTSFVAYLKEIRHTAELNNGGKVLLDEHIIALKEFIRHYYCHSDEILVDFDLDNCEFFVALPPTPRNQHKCLWIKEKGTDKQRHFSTTDKSLKPATSFENFYQYCTHLIMPIKLKLRNQIASGAGLSASEFDLWHKHPRTKELIQEFIDLKGIGNVLESIISPNGLGNNIPFLMSEYKYLEQEFIEFYQNKIATELSFELKARNTYDSKF